MLEAPVRPVAQLLPIGEEGSEPHGAGVNPFRLPVLLFILACLTTCMLHGWIYSLSLMSILLAHELGHYLQTLRYGVPASPPMFIPVPFGFGTMGAVIVQRGNTPNRRALFDIGVSGPLAGLALAIPLLIWSISYGKIVAVPPDAILYGDPLLVKFLIWWFHGPQPVGHEMTFDGNGVLYASWVGLLITAINLMPFGQLDGGHVLYCLIGRAQHRVAETLFRLILVTLFFYGLFVSWMPVISWMLMLMLIARMGLWHPPTIDDSIQLDLKRKLIGWLTMALLVLLFVPVPIRFVEGSPAPPHGAGAAQQAPL